MARSILSELIAANGSFQRPREFASLEQEKAFEESKKALTAEAEKRWNDPAWHRDQAALIAENLDYGFKFENSFSEYIPTQAVGKHEKILVKERGGLKVFYTHRAGEIEESVLRSDVWELPRDTLGWHVSEFEDDVQANYGDTVAELVPLARLREDTEVTRRIFQLVREAVPNGSASHVDAATGLTPAALNKAIADIGDIAPPSNVSIARPITIVGRAAAIEQVLDLPGYTDDAKEEIRKTGRLGVYRGATVRKITNWTDDDGLSFIPDDELYVLGGYIGKFGIYGGPTVKSYTEDKVDFHHFKSRRDVGGAVWRPEAIRRFSLDT